MSAALLVIIIFKQHRQQLCHGQCKREWCNVGGLVGGNIIQAASPTAMPRAV